MHEVNLSLLSPVLYRDHFTVILTGKCSFNLTKFLRRLVSTNGQQRRAPVKLLALCAGSRGKETVMPTRLWLRERLVMRAM